MTKARQPTDRAGHASTKDRKTQNSKEPLTNTEKVAIVLALISLIGGTVTAFFGNLDKFGKSDGPRSQTEALLALNEHHRSESERSLADAEASLSEGLRHIENDKTLASDIKRKNAAAAAKAKKVIEAERTKILNTYEKLDSAIKEGDTLKVTIHQTELKSNLLNVQRQFDKTIEGCELRKSAVLSAQFAAITPEVRRRRCPEVGSEVISAPNPPVARTPFPSRRSMPTIDINDIEIRKDGTLGLKRLGVPKL